VTTAQALLKHFRHRPDDYLTLDDACRVVKRFGICPTRKNVRRVLRREPWFVSHLILAAGHLAPAWTLVTHCPPELLP
jgi:hypothetical protein